MVSEIKTLEQIQEEFRKKLNEIKREETVVEEIIEPPVEQPAKESKEKAEETEENIPSEAKPEDKIVGFLDDDQNVFEMILKNQKRRKRVSIVRGITAVVIVLCVVGSVLSTVMAHIGRNPDKVFLGYGFYPEYNNLMSPKYTKGDMVLYEGMELEQIVEDITMGSYIVTYTNNERKYLCVARVEMFVRDNITGDVYYKIKTDKPAISDEFVHVRLVKGKAKYYPLKWFAFGTYYVEKYIKYFAISFASAFLVAFIIRSVFGRKIIEDEEEFDVDDEEELDIEEDI